MASPTRSDKGSERASPPTHGQSSHDHMGSRPSPCPASSTDMTTPVQNNGGVGEPRADDQGNAADLANINSGLAWDPASSPSHTISQTDHLPTQTDNQRHDLPPRPAFLPTGRNSNQNSTNNSGMAQPTPPDTSATTTAAGPSIENHPDSPTTGDSVDPPSFLDTDMLDEIDGNHPHVEKGINGLDALIQTFGITTDFTMTTDADGTTTVTANEDSNEEVPGTSSMGTTDLPGGTDDVDGGATIQENENDMDVATQSGSSNLDESETSTAHGGPQAQPLGQATTDENAPVTNPPFTLPSIAIASASGTGRSSSGSGLSRPPVTIDINNPYYGTQLQFVRGEILGICKDRNGCRFLQFKLAQGNRENIRLIFDDVKNHIVELMEHPVGSYFSPTLVEYVDDEQRKILILNVAPELARLALTRYGTRAVQKIVGLLSTPEQLEAVTGALRSRIVELMQNVYGCHVVVACLKELTCADTKFIVDAAAENCVALATHRHGCSTLQRCIDHATGAKKTRIVNQVLVNLFLLVRDQFGNYACQHILEIEQPNFAGQLIDRIIGHAAVLSCQKYSSNVVEKCLRKASPQQRHVLVNELLAMTVFARIVRDMYGNYVIQAIMDVADVDKKKYIVRRIRPMLMSMRHLALGRVYQAMIDAYDDPVGAADGLQTSVDAVGSAGEANVTNENAMPMPMPMPMPNTSQGYQQPDIQTDIHTQPASENANEMSMVPVNPNMALPSIPESGPMVPGSSPYDSLASMLSSMNLGGGSGGIWSVDSMPHQQPYGGFQGAPGMMPGYNMMNPTTGYYPPGLNFGSYGMPPPSMMGSFPQNGHSMGQYPPNSAMSGPVSSNDIYLAAMGMMGPGIGGMGGMGGMGRMGSMGAMSPMLGNNMLNLALRTATSGTMQASQQQQPTNGGMFGPGGTASTANFNFNFHASSSGNQNQHPNQHQNQNAPYFGHGNDDSSSSSGRRELD
ncbi:MAG: hypothetical protein M1823_004375 [Watsoniomyces obsoletus]|nr:MAG: hypothetical protein M1823_004375 [Watsoniomyces obsoletus]